jgi:hypothetical protein
MALNFSLHFNCTTKVAYVKDDTVYSFPNSVSKYAVGSLVSPLGLSVFNKTTIGDPLINNNASPRVSANYNLGGTIPAGNYTLSLSNIYEYESIQGTNEYLQVTANNELYILGVDLTEVLFPGGSFEISASTGGANDGTYTISTIEYTGVSTRITIPTTDLTITDGPDEAAEINAESTVVYTTNQIFTYSACNSSVCLDLSFTYDAFSTQYGNATLADLTTYTDWTISNRELSLYYPAGLDPAPEANPIVTPTANINVNVLATGLYTGKLVVTISNIQNDGLVLDLNLTKTKQFSVIAYTEMCGIQSCITRMLDRHVSYLRSATVSPLQQFVDQVYGLYINAKEALACGDKVSYSSYVSQIYAILGTTQDDCGNCSCGGSCSDCNDSCGCGQPDEPVWIDNLGIDVNSLLAEFEIFMEETLPTLEATVESLNTTVTDVILPAISDLETSVASIGSQTTTNTGDISGLTTQVDTLAVDVATLQEQIGEFSPSNSEIALNELFTNDGSNKLLYMAASGGPAAGSETIKYVVNLYGNVEADLTEDDSVVFYSTGDSAWYQGFIFSFEYKSGPNQTQIVVQTFSSISTSWSTSTSPFPFFLAKPSTGIYNFTKQFTLQNANYWKLEDDTTKYWAKLKTSFLWNCTNGGSDSLIIFNDTNSQELELRGINPGTMIDLELTFEKQYDGSDYDLVYMLDIKSTTSQNKNIVDGDLLDAGYTGYNPKENSDLYQNTSRNIVVTPNMGGGVEGIFNVTQDVYNTEGLLNSNRVISRYASGPSYPSNVSTQFFTGGNDIIGFNIDNCNITILNFEVSFGKMPA